MLSESYINDYKRQHQILNAELKKLMCNIILLNECIKNYDRFIYASIQLKRIYETIFELVIIKTYKIVYDNNDDVLSINKFHKRIMNNLNSIELKKALSKNIKESKWKSHGVESIKRKLKQPMKYFRNNYIAHLILSEKGDEYQIELKDVSELIYATIDLFNILTFYPNDFYSYPNGAFSFTDEKILYETECYELISLLLLSSFDVTEIDFKFNECDCDDKYILECINNINKSRANKIMFNSNSHHRDFSFIIDDLLKIEEFRFWFNKNPKINDEEIVKLICVMKNDIETNEKDSLKEYKLNIINNCIDKIRKCAIDLYEIINPNVKSDQIIKLCKLLCFLKERKMQSV